MSPFGDIMDGRRDVMTLESTIDTPAAAGAIIRARRTDQGAVPADPCRHGRGVTEVPHRSGSRPRPRRTRQNPSRPGRPRPDPGRHRSHAPRQRLRPGTAGLRGNLHPAHRRTGLRVRHQNARRLRHRIPHRRQAAAPAQPPPQGPALVSGPGRNHQLHRTPPRPTQRHPGRDASSPSTRRGCRPSPTGPSGHP